MSMRQISLIFITFVLAMSLLGCSNQNEEVTSNHPDESVRIMEIKEYLDNAKSKLNLIKESFNAVYQVQQDSNIKDSIARNVEDNISKINENIINGFIMEKPNEIGEINDLFNQALVSYDQASFAMQEWLHNKDELWASIWNKNLENANATLEKFDIQVSLWLKANISE